MNTIKTYSPREVGALTGFSQTFVLQEIRAGRLKALRGQSWFKVPRASLEAWLTARYTGGAVRVGDDGLEFFEEEA
jgi:hypothetical protein